MKKKCLIILVIALLVLNTGCNNKKVRDIEKTAIQTHEFYEDRGYDNKYIIENEGDLEKFTTIFSDKLDSYRDKLNDNTIFVQLVKKGSGSIKLEVKNVDFANDKVNFVINETNPGVGTADMALWYLVAVIPNSQLDGLDLSDWTNASTLVK